MRVSAVSMTNVTVVPVFRLTRYKAHHYCPSADLIFYTLFYWKRFGFKPAASTIGVYQLFSVPHRQSFRSKCSISRMRFVLGRPFPNIHRINKQARSFLGKSALGFVNRKNTDVHKHTHTAHAVDWSKIDGASYFSISLANAKLSFVLFYSSLFRAVHFMK